MIKQTVDIVLNKQEIAQIIAEYLDVSVVLSPVYSSDLFGEDKISARVKKELTFNAQKQIPLNAQKPISPVPLDVIPTDTGTGNPILNPSVTWTSEDALSNRR